MKIIAAKHLLPDLPYPLDALERHIDARTLALHHGTHHAAYVANLNAALEDLPELQGRDAMWLLLNAQALPVKSRRVIRNNAGGHVNHSLFWRAMSPPGADEPSGPLADAIRRDFGGVDQLKLRFEDEGLRRFGSGWVWLTRTRLAGGRLQVCFSAGHDNPQMRGHFPILLNDLWEHAYYLKHESRRDEYLKGWWQVVNWAEAARRFAGSDPFPEGRWEGEGGRIAATAR